jgi:hypothetical protein
MVAELGDGAWTVAEHLNDEDEVPRYAMGTDLSQVPLASEVAPVDMAEVIAQPVASPVLRARRQQLMGLTLELAFPGAKVDWRDRWGGRWLATVQNQNPCQSCWAFGTTALVETMVRIEHGVWAKRSEGDVRDGWGGRLGEDWRTRDNTAPCQHGAGFDGALNWIVANGIADPDCFPWSSMDVDYTPTADRPGRTVRVGEYKWIGDVAEQKQWLDAVGPLVAGFDAYDDFQGYGGGGTVYRKAPGATLQGGHTILVVGFDDDLQCWIIRNSWGPNWGDGGYGLLGYGECKIDEFTKAGIQGTNPDPWTRRRLHNGCFLESGNGQTHRNFEMLASGGPRLRHVWRQGGEGGDFSWHEAHALENPNDIGAGAACVGPPALIATTYNRNFETVYWEGSGWLRHWWFDQAAGVWNDAGRFGSDQTAGWPGFIQGNYGAPGNFEVVVRNRAGHLQHWWREGPPNFTWHDGGEFAGLIRASGPSLVQANVGAQGNFYVVAVTDTGQLQLWWRDNEGGVQWKAGEVFGSGVGETPPCMIQGQFGAADENGVGNFELCVAVNGQVQHWWRDNSTLATEPPAEESPLAHPFDPSDVIIHRPGASDVIEGSDVSNASEVVSREPNVELAGLLESDSPRIRRAAVAALGSAVFTTVDHAGDEVDIHHIDPDLLRVHRWQQSATFGHDAKHVWGLLEGSFGFNLEVIVERTDGALQHYFRDGEGWHEGAVIDV